MKELIDAMLKVQEILKTRDDVLGVRFDNDGIIEIHVEAKDIDASMGKISYTQRDCQYFPWEKSVMCENDKVKIFGLLTDKQMQKEFATEVA